MQIIRSGAPLLFPAAGALGAELSKHQVLLSLRVRSCHAEHLLLRMVFRSFDFFLRDESCLLVPLVLGTVPCGYSHRPSSQNQQVFGTIHQQARVWGDRTGSPTRGLPRFSGHFRATRWPSRPSQELVACGEWTQSFQSPDRVTVAPTGKGTWQTGPPPEKKSTC